MVIPGFRLFCLLGLILIASTAGAHAQQPGPQPALKVGLHVSPPFVMENAKTNPQGMAVELWKDVAANAALPFEFQTFDTVADLLRATESGTLDVAVSNLTITHERARRMDFTQPWYDGGLRLLVDANASGSASDTLQGLYSMGHLRNYAILGILIILATVLLTLFDRRFDSDFPKRWAHGLSESFYHVISMVTSGKASRKNLFGSFGKVLSAFWIVCGVGVVAYVTSSITSVMTADAITRQIDGISDLGDRTVGVFTGSVAESFAREAGLPFKSFSDIDQAAASLKKAEVAAVLADAPVLEYYAHSRPEMALEVVGTLMHPDKYAFALPSNSPLRRVLTAEILRAKEQGTLAALKTKYFGGQN
ncbi:transporter substrate-binding domain-containing protein [Microvirga pudoricolor]|uniref:transporter substrate-binding domain-containing protein n=1 Tax=Microvirga pudoricolor TaxID=2778729 RepID=UPI0019506176|nr:transporter substrate-binding domain-containing protein [Microvirga pudoricolor]MBM6595463.1 transporter substrate-binding domain-containing protein [Microvirga pudoricolor]